MVELGDTGILGRDDEGGGQAAGLLGGAEELVVVGDGHAEDQDAADVEEDDTAEGLVDGAGDVLARVGGFAESDADELGAEVGEGGLDHACPDTQEAAGRALDDDLVFTGGSGELRKGAGVTPVSEAGADVVGTAAEGDDEAEEDEHDDDESLDQRHPEFCFAEEGDVDELLLHVSFPLSATDPIRGREKKGGHTLTAIIATPNTVIHTETLISGFQYCRMIPVAVRLLGSTITYLKK